MEAVIQSTEQSVDATTEDVSATTDSSNHRVTNDASLPTLYSACTDAFQLHRFSPFALLMSIGLRLCSVCSLQQHC